MTLLSARPRRCSISLRAMVACGLFASVLHAEAPAQTDGSGLEEVVVTAQKRTETLQSVPVSVTVLTGTQLAELKIDTP